MFGLSSYNYETFRRKFLLKDVPMTKFFGGAEPGEKAPDFQARTIDGDRIRLSDFRGRRNVVLTFGSATCPLTAASIGGLNDLREQYANDEVEFLFVYVREAHPGEALPAHHSMAQKLQAAEQFREIEQVEMPIVLDDLDGHIHRKYGKAPNPSFLIDKTGRVAFRALHTNPKALAEAIEELLSVQKESGRDHAIVHGGESSGIPAIRAMLHTHRALRRGGNRAIEDFQNEMGMPGRLAVIGGRLMDPIVERPRTVLAMAAAVAGVVGFGVWGGIQLRKRRLGMYRNPYDYGQFPSRDPLSSGDYEAVGI